MIDNNPFMNSADEKPIPSSPRESFGLRAIWIVSTLTLVVFLILLSTGHIRLSQSGTSIVTSLVYTAFIALPSIVFLTGISIRMTKRFPRLIVLIQAGVLVCTATVGTFAGAVVVSLSGLSGPGGYGQEVRGTLPFSVVISLIFGLSISTFETMRYKLQAASLELRTRQVEQERANKLLVQARLSSLESRIHPHFLFNTLNSIAALIPSDPARAEDTVGKLASLLRFSLNANHGGLVPLVQELKIVRNYLEIEHTRFAKRLRYQIDVPDSLNDVKVPPLALQSLVENSVKHVVAQSPQGATITVTGQLIANQVILTVFDTGPGFTLDAITPEHGLGNLIARLGLLYGQAGQLGVSREGDRTSVRMSFPAEAIE